MIPRKQYTALATLVVIILIIIVAGVFFYTNKKKTVAGDIELYQRFLSQDSRIQAGHFDHVKGLGNQLSQNKIIQQILSNNSGDSQSPIPDLMSGTINSNLLNIAAITDISAAFVMNTEGICVLASNPNFLGKDYSFRPYFKQALVKDYGLYTAMGITSKQLGIYYALPVEVNSQIIGVAVIKFSPSFFQIEPQISLSEHLPQGDQITVGLAVPGGIFFASPDYKLHSFSSLTNFEIEDIKTSQRFPVQDITPMDFPPATWEKLKQQRFLQVEDEKTGQGYHLFVEPLVAGDLCIVHIIKDSWFSVAYNHIHETQQSLLFMLYGTVLILIISLLAQGRRYQIFRRTSEALMTEQDKYNQSLARYQFIIDNSPIAFWQVDPETKIVKQANKAFCDLIGQTEKDIVGRSIFNFYSEAGVSLIQEKSKYFSTNDVLIFEIGILGADNTIIPVIQSSRLSIDPISKEKRRFAFFTDISLVKSQQETLDIFQLALAQSDNSIILTNSKGEIEYVNQSTLVATGYAQQELIGQQLHILKTDTHPDSFYSEIWETIAAGERWRGKVCNRRKDGDYYWEDATISPITNDAGEISHYLAIYIDISKEMEMDQQLRQALAEANSATKAKSEFLANMSHEIRTPMSGVIGMTRLALGTSLTKEQRQYLDQVMVSATGLLDLLNDILDFSKIEAKQLTLENRNFSLKALQENIVINLQFMAEEKGLVLEDHTDFTLVPHWAMADELRIKQILINLLGNAIKFTDSGVVSIETVSPTQNNDTFDLTFSVSDTGIGIPASKLQTIFADFSQADTSTARKYGGTGLGLSISRQLVDLMGGELEVESREGEGSLFNFTITVQVGHEVETSRWDPDAGKEYSLRVLLVDDNYINQEIARATLETFGCLVNVADNGLVALRLLADHEFDMILMDIQMPVLDGFCTCHYIRSLEDDPTFKVHGVCTKRSADVLETEECHASRLVGQDLRERLKKALFGKHNYIVAITANAMAGDKEKCLGVGMDDYLTKPFLPEDIMGILNQSERMNVNNEALEENPTPVSLKEQGGNYLRKIYKLADAQVEMLLAKSAEQLQENMDWLKEVWQERDVHNIHQASHKLKGGLLSLGFDELAKQATIIELAAKENNLSSDSAIIDGLAEAVAELVQSLAG